MSYAYAGAWYVDTLEAVQALRGAGCNVFCVPAGLPPAQLDATLAAVQAGEWAIVDLSGYGATQNWNREDGGAERIVQALIGRPNILGYFSFDEPNNGSMPADTNVAVQRGWYNVIKATDPGKAVFVNYVVTGEGFVDDGAVVAQRGLAWDYVCVDAYPLRWGVSDMEAGGWLIAAANAVRAKFPADTWILPIQQMAGCSICPQPQPGRYDWKTLRSPAGLLQAQYDIWSRSGCLDPSHTLLGYGWGTVAASDPTVSADEDISLKWRPELLREFAGVVATHRHVFGL